MNKQAASVKLFGLFALAGLFAAPVFAAPETFVVDPNHTYPRFEYSHLGYSKQIQRFNKTSGTIVVDRAAKTGAVDISIDARSVDTGYPLFDEHIQGEDYLDTANYPTITYQSTAVFFSPDDFFAHPDLRPIGSDGKPFEPFTWYHGICPTSTAYLDRKVEKFSEAVAVTQTDGVFLSFLRFPAFWELWMPEHTRADITEYCFCDRCTGLFEDRTGLSLPAGLTERVGVLTHELRAQWTDFKCAHVADVAGRLRAAAEEVRPGVDVILNSFGLGSTEYDNAVEEALSQRFSDLDPVIDHYELMFYFQIQKRDPVEWIPRRVAETKAKTGRTILADLQGDAEYLEDVYAADGRRREISAQEWHDALGAVAASGADGLMIYSWRDLLADEARGGSRVRDLLAYKAGEL